MFCGRRRLDLGRDLGQNRLGLVVSIIGMLGIVENQLLYTPSFAPDALQLLRQLDPHLG